MLKVPPFAKPQTVIGKAIEELVSILLFDNFSYGKVFGEHPSYMKSLFKVITLIFLVTVNFSCRTQKLMRTLSDTGKLEENKQVFVYKPLKTLLKEIKPKIKFVSVDGQRADGGISIIIFKFTDWEERKKYNLAGETPLSIVVRIKERFEWNKPRTEIFTWTKADAKKFANLTVASVGVVGETL